MSIYLELNEKLKGAMRDGDELAKNRHFMNSDCKLLGACECSYKDTLFVSNRRPSINSHTRDKKCQTLSSTGP